jgi:alanine racemase
MEPSSRLWIDLDAVTANVRAMRERLPATCTVAGVVKADAYGLGLVPIARAIAGGGGGMLVVFDPSEAARLLEAGIDRPVLLLGALLDPVEEPALLRGSAGGFLHLAVSAPRHLSMAADLADRVGRAVPVHVEVDTGMARAGCDPREAGRLVATAMADPRLRLAGVCTHMADADDDATVLGQAAVFRAVLDGLPPLPTGCRIHLANTRTALRHPELAADMARSGQGWAGFGGHDLPDPPRLRRVVRWTSRIVQVRHVETGQGVGYGRRWQAGRPTRIGLVPVGYADGLPRSLIGETGRERMRVGLGEGPTGRPLAWAPVIGAISMDQVTIDLTDVPAGIDVSPGAAVEVVGRDPEAPNDLGRIAAAAGTTHHELLCRIGSRVRRMTESAADLARTPSLRPAVMPA